jgi:hypothetical protein
MNSFYFYAQDGGEQSIGLSGRPHSRSVCNGNKNITGPVHNRNLVAKLVNLFAEPPEIMFYFYGYVTDKIQIEPFLITQYRCDNKDRSYFMTKNYS